ncbi:hypothetical protein [Roseibium sp.]|uniref:hypothetical protein n=1 Tax=Roseibium sp. TaxID=1936156 RepID=UPI00326550C0
MSSLDTVDMGAIEDQGGSGAGTVAEQDPEGSVAESGHAFRFCRVFQKTDLTKKGEIRAYRRCFNQQCEIEKRYLQVFTPIKQVGSGLTVSTPTL